jgi:RNA polymerase sigma factor (sigma-70 family)
VDDTSGGAGYEEFFRQEYPELVAFLRANGFNPEEAKDAAEDAMTDAYRSWVAIASPRKWVRTAAYRIACRAVARRKEEFRRVVENGLFDSVYYDRSLEDRAEQEQILQLLDKLPVTQRQVMAWHLEGFNTKEISIQLVMSEVTVRSNLRHAREKMKKAFPGPQYTASDGGTE